MPTNVQRGQFFRALIANALSQSTGRDVDYRRPLNTLKLSDRIGKSQSDIVGLPGWSIATRTGTPFELSMTLDLAKSAASADGNEFHAAIVARPGAEAEDSYVILNLETFGKLLMQGVAK
jgi:hypothetical protein